jgi:hypothetical protein
MASTRSVVCSAMTTFSTARRALQPDKHREKINNQIIKREVCKALGFIVEIL